MNYNLQPDHLRKEPEVNFEAGWINRLYGRMELKTVAEYIRILTARINAKNSWGKNEIREQMNEALLQLLSQEQK